MTFLADIFEKLANDPSWPRIPEEADSRGTTEFKWCVHNKDDTFHVFRTEQEAREYAESPLDMARLALMVVDAEKRRLEVIDPEWTAEALGINPDYYANVKKRVAEVER